MQFIHYARALYLTRERQFYEQWLLFNTIGWSAGLIIGTLISGGVLPDLQICLVPLTGVVVGGIVGAFQGVPLRLLRFKSSVHRDWTVSSAIGGMLGAICVSLVLFAILLGTGTGSIVIGMVFGVCMGAAQSVVLCRQLPHFPYIWITANAFGGCVCSWCAYGFNPLSLPIFCTLGPPLFAVITALAWHFILHMDIEA